MASTSRKTDAQHQQDVLRELKRDPRLKEAAIGVEVSRGIVTLMGAVTSHDARAAAQEAAHRVEGVLDVANDIEVHTQDNSLRTDTDVARAIREALESDVSEGSDQIQSTVSNGGVTLEGQVDTLAQRESAEAAVRRVDGVQRVTNRIAVRSPITYQEI
jgi:osmotically-inducible protein OsmY